MNITTEAHLFTDNHNRIILRISDEASQGDIIELHLTSEQLSKLVLGRQATNVATVIHPTKHVGRVREHKMLALSVRKVGQGTRTDYEKYLQSPAVIEKLRVAHAGWTISPSLSSQSSITYEPSGRATLNVHAYRYGPRPE